MKKVSKVLAAVLCVCLSIITLTACSKYDALLKAFEEEGYKENTEFTTVIDGIKEELEKEEYAVELHYLDKGNLTGGALIIEFKSTKELQEAYKDSNTLQGFVQDVKENEDIKDVYNALVDAGYAKGNCLILPLSAVNYIEITKIVKSVK